MVEATIEQFERDGAACLRAVLDLQWVERMRAAVDRVMSVPSERFINYTKEGNPGKFHHDMLMWRHDADFRALVLESPLAAVAATLLRAERVNFFYDQLFVKEPGTQERTPWHQDLPYWPLRGMKILGLWVALDDVTAESGAVEYVAGSHLSGKWFRPRHFGGADQYPGAQGDPMPDLDAERAAHRFLRWDVQAGDLIAFHALTIHGSGGNLTTNRRRRAVSLRWCGEDVTWDSRPGTYPFPNPGLANGAPLDSEQYPVVWNRG